MERGAAGRRSPAADRRLAESASGMLLSTYGTGQGVVKVEGTGIARIADALTLQLYAIASPRVRKRKGIVRMQPLLPTA